MTATHDDVAAAVVADPADLVAKMEDWAEKQGGGADSVVA